jgi:hypothetical protein
MVEEHAHRLLVYLSQAGGEPRQAPGAQDTLMCPRFDRIQKDHPPFCRVEHRLYKPLRVNRDIAKDLAKRGAVVMIPNHQPPRHGQGCQELTQVQVRVSLAIIDKIADQHTERRIGMVRIDVSDSTAQTLPRIKAFGRFARGHNVGVRQNQEFHARTSFLRTRLSK